MAVYKNIEFLSSSVLPQVKTLKEEKARLNKLQDYLDKRLKQQGLYLKAFSEISGGKPQYVEIQEVEAKTDEAKLSLSLSGTASAYEDVNIFLVNLKKAGCVRLNFGIESGNDAVLDMLRKNFTTDDVRKAVRMARKAGLEVDGMFMIGLPGENEETIKNTVDIAIELNVRYAIFNLTQLDKVKDAKGLIKILGTGEVKGAVTVSAHKVSAAAKQKIEAAGGKVNIIKNV